MADPKKLRKLRTISVKLAMNATFTKEWQDRFEALVEEISPRFYWISYPESGPTSSREINHDT